MSETALDVRSTVALLRRRSRFVVAGAVLGLGAALLLLVLNPPRVVSTTLVLLPAPTQEQGVNDVATQVRIVRSTTVLGRAGKAVRPALTARQMEGRVRVTAPTEQLLEIGASAVRPAEAQALAKAVADAYVASTRETALSVTRAALGELADRERALQDQMDSLAAEIRTTEDRQQDVRPDSPDGRREAQLHAQLIAERADISERLDLVQDQIISSAPVGSAPGVGTAVIQAPSPARGESLLDRMLLWGPIGLVTGAGLMALTVLVTARRDPRLRLRSDIADALGSPVLAAVRSRPQRSVAGWWALLESDDTGPVDAWAFRQLLRALVPADRRTPGKADHPVALTVVSLAGDTRGLAIGPQLAGFAAGIGIVTRLVPGPTHDSAAPLWSAFTGDRSVTPRPGLVLGHAAPDALVDLTITIAVLDRRRPELDLQDEEAGLVVALAAGAATEEELARIAVAVDVADQQIDAVVLADPDRADRTSGRHLLETQPRHAAASRPAGRDETALVHRAGG